MIDIIDELSIRRLIELMRMENVSADRETVHGDGWLYDHAQRVREIDAEIGVIMAKYLPDPEKSAYLRKEVPDPRYDRSRPRSADETENW